METKSKTVMLLSLIGCLILLAFVCVSIKLAYDLRGEEKSIDTGTASVSEASVSEEETTPA